MSATQQPAARTWPELARRDGPPTRKARRPAIVPAALSIGLHPAGAVTAATVDYLQSRAVAASGLDVTLAAIATALAVLVPCTLIQLHLSKDPWRIALAKAIAATGLALVPTAALAIVTLAWGYVGAVDQASAPSIRRRPATNTSANKEK